VSGFKEDDSGDAKVSYSGGGAAVESKMAALGAAERGAAAARAAERAKAHAAAELSVLSSLLGGASAADPGKALVRAGTLRVKLISLLPVGTANKISFARRHGK
jgi:hypothetical protein